MVNLRPLSIHRRGRLQAARRRSAPSVGRREQGPAGDVSGGLSPVDAETSGPVRAPAARAAMSLYARRLASPHSPGRHLDCHAVGDWRPGCRSMPALKHALAWVLDEVRYLTRYLRSYLTSSLLPVIVFALSLFWRVSKVNELPSVLPNVAQYWRCACRVNTLQFDSDKAQNLLSKLHEHCLIRFALCRIWNVCRNAALRRNSTFIRRIRCALSPKLIALFSNTSSLILINCDSFEYGCTMPYCRKLTALFPNYVHCFQNWPEKGVDGWRRHNLLDGISIAMQSVTGDQVAAQCRHSNTFLPECSTKSDIWLDIWQDISQVLCYQSFLRSPCFDWFRR